MTVRSLKPLAIAGSLMVMVGGVIAFWSRPSAVQLPVPVPQNPELAQQMPAADQPLADSDAPLPWMGSPLGAGNPAAQPAGQLTPSRDALATTQQRQQQMVANIDRQAQNNLQALDQLDSQFEQLERTGKVPEGVDVKKVRQNLRLVRRTQELSRELGNLVMRDPSPEKTERMRQIGDELLMVQTQMQQLNPAQFAARP